MQIQSFNHLSAGAFSSPCLFQCGKVQFQVMSVHLRSQEPHLAIPEHEHPVFELSTMVRGEMTSFCDGASIFCSEENGRIFLMPPMTLHNRKFGKGEENINLTVTLQISSLEIQSEEIIHLLASAMEKKRFSAELSPLERALLQELLFQGKSSGYPPGASQILREGIQLFLRLFFQRNFSASFRMKELERPLSRDEKLVNELKNILENALMTPSSRPDLEKSFSMSRRHLVRLFRKVTGETIQSYIRRRKLALAKDLLSAGSCSIEEIAAVLGFRTNVRFSQFFRQYTNMSPREYRVHYGEEKS